MMRIIVCTLALCFLASASTAFTPWVQYDQARPSSISLSDTARTKQNTATQDAFDEDRSASLMMLNVKKEALSRRKEARKKPSSSPIPYVTGVPSLKP